MTKRDQRFQEARNNPRAVYRTPEDVLADPHLDRAGKRAILQSWEQDARELAVALEESMGGGEPDMLDRVLAALAEVSGEPEGARPAPTKQGGGAHRRESRPGAARRNRDLRAGDIMCVPGDVLHPDHQLVEARGRLEDAGISLLPVVDGDEVVGILTEAAVRTWVDAPASPETDSKVTDYMSASVPICRTDESLESLAKVVERESRPGLLVVDGQDQLMGIVTREMLEDAGYVFGAAGARRGVPAATPHAVKTAARARGERHGWLKSYAVRPQVRR